MKIRILKEAGEPGDVVDMTRQRAQRQIEQGLAVPAEEGDVPAPAEEPVQPPPADEPPHQPPADDPPQV